MAHKFYDEVLIQKIGQNGKSAVNKEYISGVILESYEQISGLVGDEISYFSGNLTTEVTNIVSELVENNSTIINNIVESISGDFATKEELEDVKDLISGGHQWVQSVKTIALRDSTYDPAGAWRVAGTTYLVHVVDTQTDYELAAGADAWVVFNDKTDYASELEVSGLISTHNTSADAHSGLFEAVDTSITNLTTEVTNISGAVNYISGDVTNILNSIIQITEEITNLTETVSGDYAKCEIKSVTATDDGTGNSVATVVFDTPFISADYTISAYIGPDSVYPAISAQSNAGFTANFGPYTVGGVKFIAIGK